MKTFLASLLSILLLGCSPVGHVEDFTSLRQATWELSVNGRSHCSAVAIAPGKALTAAHCKGDEMLLGSYPVQVIKVNEVADIMLLEVTGLECPCVPIAKGIPAVDAMVVVVGYPLEAGQVVTQGRVQQNVKPTEELGPKAEHMRIITAPIIFGNSGGPVFAIEEGKYVVVGIVSMVSVASNGFFGGSPIPHLGLMVKTEVIKEFVNSLH